MRHRLHWVTRWRMHRLFTRGLAPRVRRSLLHDLARCSECAQLYRSYGLAEAVFCGVPPGPTPFTLERVGASVLHAIDAREPASRRRRWHPALLKACAAALALAAVLLFLRPPGSRRERVALSPQAAIVPVALVAKGNVQGAADVGIRVFAVGEAGNRVDERPSLSRHDMMTFTYSNLSPRIRALALFGVQSDGVVRWYYPGYDGDRSISITSDRVDEPLGDGIRLSVNHTAGWLRITAVFSETPLDVALIERSIRELSSHPGAVQTLSPFNLPGGVVEQSVLVEVHD